MQEKIEGAGQMKNDEQTSLKRSFDIAAELDRVSQYLVPPEKAFFHLRKKFAGVTDRELWRGYNIASKRNAVGFQFLTKILSYETVPDGMGLSSAPILHQVIQSMRASDVSSAARPLAKQFRTR
jgi:hypothetical protein